MVVELINYSEVGAFVRAFISMHLALGREGAHSKP